MTDTMAEPVPDVTTLLGVHDIPDTLYHSDRSSMSSTAAKRILRPGCPAQVEYDTAHPKHKDIYDLGTVTHLKILGKGPQILEVKSPTWNKKADQEIRAQARAEGVVAILSKDLAMVEQMADAVRMHPRVKELLADGTGVPERSVFWIDEETGIRRRAMLDWFPTGEGKGQPIAADVKTTTDCSPQAIARAIWKLRYFQQDPFHRDGLAAAGIPDAGFAFIFVDKNPPHLVTVVQLDEDYVVAGWRRNRKAIDVWDACKRTGIWPDYGQQIHTISAPPWVDTDIENEE